MKRRLSAVQLNWTKIKLSFGQVARAMCHGREPDRVSLDRLRYLRQLGVPFGAGEGQGRGNRMSYSFDHLAECGIEIESMRRGLKPMEAAKAIVAERKELRRLAHKAFDELPDGIKEGFHGGAMGLREMQIEGEFFSEP